MKLFIAYYKFLKFVLFSLGIILTFVSSIVFIFGEEWLVQKIGGEWSFKNPELGLLIGFLLILAFILLKFLDYLWLRHGPQNKKEVKLT